MSLGLNSFKVVGERTNGKLKLSSAAPIVSSSLKVNGYHCSLVRSFLRRKSYAARYIDPIAHNNFLHITQRLGIKCDSVHMGTPGFG